MQLSRLQIQPRGHPLTVLGLYVESLVSMSSGFGPCRPRADDPASTPGTNLSHRINAHTVFYFISFGRTLNVGIESRLSQVRDPHCMHLLVHSTCATRLLCDS
jgi:hypothetical protein